MTTHKLQEEQLAAMMKRPIPKKKIGIVHLQMVKDSQTLYGIKRFTNPEEAVRMVKPLVQMADRELFLVMSLNTKLEPLVLEIAAVGSLNTCAVDCRDVFKHCILNNAAFIVCFHNHPSGHCQPSREDSMLTKKLEKSGALLGIRLVDHIIIGDDTYYSFKEHGGIDLYPTEDAA